MNEAPVVGESEEKKEKRKRRILVGILVAIILVLLFIIFSRSSDPVNPVEHEKQLPRPGIGQVVDGDIPNMSEDQIKELLKKKQDASRFTVAVSSAATFEKGSRILKLMAANSDKNSVDCYFEILDNGEVIYTSPLMKPKQYIQTAELSRELSNDVNNLIIRFNGVYQGNIISVVEAEIRAISKAKGV